MSDEIVPIESTIRAEEREHLDKLAGDYNTTRRGIIRLAVRFLIDNPTIVSSWHDSVEGEIVEHGMWLDNLGRQVPDPATEE